MNNNQIKAFIKSGELTRKSISDGLYIRVQTAGKAHWEVRYSFHGKRRVMTLDGGGYPEVSLADARAKVAEIKKLAKEGKDPLAERQRDNSISIKTMDELFEDWHAGLIKRLKHPEIPKRIYQKEIRPLIGSLPISHVTAMDIREIIEKVAKSKRPSTANDTLMYCKQLFNHAFKLDLTTGNPASAFKTSDAGGIEKSRERALKLSEIEKVFHVLRTHSEMFTRDNYLAIAILLCLGVRKGELIAAQWSEIDLKAHIWHLPKERSKTGIATSIPLPSLIIPWFEELKVRACLSDFLFPARKAGKRRAYISDDTLNHALGKMFGKKVAGNGREYENILGSAGIEHFTIHDLRRTCRSLLAEMGVAGHIAERCLNHKLKGVEGIYDRHDYLTERREALNSLASLIYPLVNIETPKN